MNKLRKIIYSGIFYIDNDTLIINKNYINKKDNVENIFKNSMKIINEIDEKIKIEKYLLL